MKRVMVALASVALLTAAACGGNGPPPQEATKPSEPPGEPQTGAAPQPVGEVPEGVLLVQAESEVPTAFGIGREGGVRQYGGGFQHVASPDRSRTAFLVGPVEQPSGVGIATAAGREVFEAKAPQPRLGTAAVWPTLMWSPDGGELAYTLPGESNPQLGDVYVVKADGSGRRQITTSPGQYGLVAWVAGRGLVVSEWRESGSRLALMGREERELAVPPEAFNFWSFTPSPDGRQLAFYSGTWEAMELWAMELETGQARRLADMGGQARRPPAGLYVSAGLPLMLEGADEPDPLLKGPPPLAWSPESGRIAYTRTLTNENGEFVGSQLRVVDVGSGAEVAAVEGGGGWQAAWSPDGRYLATTGEAGRVVLLGADGLTREVDVTADQLLWSKGGRLIAASAYGGISMIDAESGEAREVLTAEGRRIYQSQLWEPVWSPSGRYLAFATLEMTGDYNLPAGSLYVLDTEAGEVTLILDKGFFRPVGWLQEAGVG